MTILKLKDYVFMAKLASGQTAAKKERGRENTCRVQIGF
jgi:hypothetical protein